jgi:hypothetical protein
MFQTVTKYLWGDSSDDTQSHTDKGSLELEQGIGDGLETHQEEDWIIVRVADKENNGHLVQHTLCSQHPCYHHHQVQSHHSQSLFVGDENSICLNTSTTPDAIVLDESDTVEQSISTNDLYFPLVDTPDFSIKSLPYDYELGNLNMDLFSKTDFTPKSVFSDCSSRFQEICNPRSHQLEPWMVTFPKNLANRHTDIKPCPILLDEMFKNSQLAQQMQEIEAKKLISRSKCEGQNKVREYQSHAKNNNRRNKRMNPSGCKASRFSQHK